eukprot:11330983-Karenia_brevis.AAC.1
MIIRIAKDHDMTAASLYTLTNEGIIISGTPGAESLTTGAEGETLHGAPIPRSSTREQPGSEGSTRPSQEPH